MFDFKVTQILTDVTISKVPKEWREYLASTSLEVFNNSVMRRQLCSDAPHFITTFKNRLNKVEVNFTVMKNESKKMSPEKSRGLTRKKIHEILNFSAFIQEKCSSTPAVATTVIDVGSGLGYIGGELVAGGLDVVGIEGNRHFHQAAIKRSLEEKKRRLVSAKISDATLEFEDTEDRKERGKMSHVNFMFDNSPETVEMLDNSVGSSPSTMIALHACGDLTPDIFRIFSKFSPLQSLSVVSCCYHKIKNKDNFPLSQELSKISGRQGTDFFNHYFLRLGSQETIDRWLNMSASDHADHSKNVVFRSILEIFSLREGRTLKKTRRKAVRKDDVTSFSTFVSSVSDSYQLELSDSDKEKLGNIYQDKSHLFDYAENLTGCQYLIQGVIESLIVCDRAQYLQEQGFCVTVHQIFDQIISPRSKVLHAVKPHQKDDL